MVVVLWGAGWEIAILLAPKRPRDALRIGQAPPRPAIGTAVGPWGPWEGQTMTTVDTMSQRTRREVPSKYERIPELAFAIEVPPEFVTPDLPEEGPRFEEPTFMLPLWLASSPVAMALVTVAVRPAYEDGTVKQWLEYLCREQGLEVRAIGAGLVGAAEHQRTAVLAEAGQEQEGTRLRFRIAAVEDGGYLYVVMGMAPEELWASYGEALAHAVGSFELTAGKGARADIGVG